MIGATEVSSAGAGPGPGPKFTESAELSERITDQDDPDPPEPTDPPLPDAPISAPVEPDPASLPEEDPDRPAVEDVAPEDAPPASAPVWVEEPTLVPDTPPRTRREKHWSHSPGWIMLRSLLVPGWGQLANRKYVKAAVVAAAEGYLIFRAVEAGLEEQDARDAAERNPDMEAAFLAEAERKNETRRDFTWWAVFAAVLSMGDAYVDAYLGPFEPEFESLDEGRGFRAGLRLEWP